MVDARRIPGGRGPDMSAGPDRHGQDPNEEAPPPGLEPGHKAPKASVLPITPQGMAYGAETDKSSVVCPGGLHYAVPGTFHATV
ncbi:hypothetical protein BN2537_10313 [Streptomyces venezuelae]|nr:hypothetical protein BN2537_10313 [Streptomyces venezuelae]